MVLTKGHAVFFGGNMELYVFVAELLQVGFYLLGGFSGIAFAHVIADGLR